MNNESVGFILKQIKTEQFALLDENINTDKNVAIRVDLGFGLDKENRTLKVLFKSIYEKQNLPFIILEVACFFEITPDSFAGFKIQEDEKIVIPCGFIKHLSVITVGTSRGVLHAKTENSPYNKYLLPTINVNDLVKDDLLF